MKVHCAHTEMLDVSKLVPHPRNPNKHSDSQIKELAKIIDAHGWRWPIKVSNRSGFITGGHGRLMAAKLKGWDTVPVDKQDYSSEAEEYQDMVADNKIQELAETDMGMVYEDILKIEGLDYDLLGIPDFKVPDIIEPGCGDDEVPEYVEPKTKIGDLYQLGNHRLLCGDSTDILQVEKLMNGEKANITFTSPPYNAGRKPMKSEREKSGKQDNKYNQYKDNGDPNDWKQLISDSLVSSMTASFYQLFNVQHLAGNKIQLLEWLHDFRNRYVDTVIWDKQHGIPSMADNVLNSRFEYIFIFADHEGPTRGISNANFSKDLDNVYSAPRQTKNEFSDIHAATFPVHLPEHFISKFCKEKGSVLDPFGGTGTTLIACEKTNRKCYMMELDPHYCDVIVARWEKYTGNKAELING